MKVDSVSSFFMPVYKKEAICTAAVLFASCYIGYKWLVTDRTPKIYSPQKWGNLAPYAEKVEEVRKKSGVIGLSFVTCRDSKREVPVYIEKLSSFCGEEFIACDLATDERIGSALIHPFLETTRYMEDYYVAGVPDDLAGYGPNDEPVEKVYVASLRSLAPESYKNVGVVLIKAAIEHYKDKCEGRVALHAEGNTPSFYYKLGFRISKARDLKNQAVIAELARRCQKRETGFGTILMHLPDDARSLWFQEIGKNPIASRLYHEVTKIYTLPKGDLAPYAGRVEEIRNDPRVIGFAFVQSGNRPVPIYIKKISSSVVMNFNAYDLESDKKIGVAESLSGDGQSMELTWIQNLSPETHKNVGAALIKAFLHYYRGAFAGQMHLISINNSAPFYYKLGFRVSEPKEYKKEAVMAKLADSHQRGTVASVDMYLPEAARILWFNEIDKNPIL